MIEAWKVLSEMHACGHPYIAVESQAPERAFVLVRLAEALLLLRLETAVYVTAYWEMAFLGAVAGACYLGLCLDQDSLRLLRVRSPYLRTNVFTVMTAHASSWSA